jgi:hypothetical protein
LRDKILRICNSWQKFIIVDTDSEKVKTTSLRIMSDHNSSPLERVQNDIRMIGYGRICTGIVVGAATAVFGLFANPSPAPRCIAPYLATCAIGTYVSTHYIMSGVCVVDAAARITEKHGATAHLGPMRVVISEEKYQYGVTGFVHQREILYGTNYGLLRSTVSHP